MPKPDDHPPLRLALVACRTAIAAVMADVISRIPALEPAFLRTCRRAARRRGLVFGLCWAINVRLNDVLRRRGAEFRKMTIAGTPMWLDVTDQSGFGLYFYGHQYEARLTATLLERLQDGDVFVDVGANTGFFTLLAANRVGERGRVVAFEPHPGARASLVRLLDRNDVAARVTVVASAVSDSLGSQSLHLTGPSALSTLDPSVAPGREHFVYTQTVTVDLTTLDDWMRQHPDLPSRISLIKVDVEGLEDKVIAGARHTLAQAPRAHVVCETNAGSAADRQLLAAGFDAVTLEPPEGSYPGNRFYSPPRTSYHTA